MTGTGIITRVSLKRKLRDYLAAVHGVSLYHANGVVLREQRATALTRNGITPSGEEEPEEAAEEGEKKKTRKTSGREAVSGAELRRNQQIICGEYWDARTFGALMDTGAARAANARGPVTISSALSVDPVRIIEQSITRQSVEKVEEGRKDKDRENVCFSGDCSHLSLFKSRLRIRPIVAVDRGDASWHRSLKDLSFSSKTPRQTGLLAN